MVEIIPKREVSSHPIVNYLFLASLMTAVLVVAAFFALQTLQERTRSKVQKLEQRLLAEPTADQKELEEEVLGFKQKLEDFEALATSRRTPLPLLSLLETSIHPSVVFTGLSVNLEQKRVLLFGETDSFKHVDEQILLLRTKQEVLRLQLAKIELGEKGRAEFALDLELPEAFKP